MIKAHGLVGTICRGVEGPSIEESRLFIFAGNARKIKSWQWVGKTNYVLLSVQIKRCESILLKRVANEK